jgi:hypothetical protein
MIDRKSYLSGRRSAIGFGALRPECLTRSSSPPNGGGRRPCSPARSRPGCWPGGWPPTRSTAPTQDHAPSAGLFWWVTSRTSGATAGCPLQPARRACRQRAQGRVGAWAWLPAVTAVNCQGPALLRLGVGPLGRPGQTPPAAHPPSPPRRTRLYHCNSLNPVRLDELVCVARRRWTIEESFLASKSLAGLDEHQVGRWLAWRRWTLLAMRVHALLAVITATERAQHSASSSL